MDCSILAALLSIIKLPKTTWYRFRAFFCASICSKESKRNCSKRAASFSASTFSKESLINCSCFSLNSLDVGIPSLERTQSQEFKLPSSMIPTSNGNIFFIIKRLDNYHYTNIHEKNGNCKKKGNLPICYEENSTL